LASCWTTFSDEEGTDRSSLRFRHDGRLRRPSNLRTQQFLLIANPAGAVRFLEFGASRWLERATRRRSRLHASRSFLSSTTAIDCDEIPFCPRCLRRPMGPQDRTDASDCEASRICFDSPLLFRLARARHCGAIDGLLGSFCVATRKRAMRFPRVLGGITARGTSGRNAFF
jgi:hypothetical protein